MKTTKNFSIVVVLLLTTAVNVSAMNDNSFNFPGLPRDMQYEVMLQYINDEINSLPQSTNEDEPASISLAIAGTKIRDLAIANKDLNSIMNQPVFCLKLIKNLAKRFNAVDDEEAAKALGTQCAQARIKLQQDFLDEVVAHYTQFSPAKLEDFIKRGVDLEWTGDGGMTPLMEAASNNKLAAVKALLKKGVNVNFVDRGGKSALYCAAIIQNYTPQDEKGTILKDGPRLKYPTSQIVEMVKTLLAAGADPKAGFLTSNGPEWLAQAISRKEVLKIIKEAQAKE